MVVAMTAFHRSSSLPEKHRVEGGGTTAGGFLMVKGKNAFLPLGWLEVGRVLLMGSRPSG